MVIEQYECLKCGCVYDECICEDKDDRIKQTKLSTPNATTVKKEG